jgi:Fe-S-cluster-containing hydrogenase component 2
MAKELFPRAQLDTRPGDIQLPDEKYLKISLFAQLKAKINLEKPPGSLVIRTYQAGEVMYRQGEAGWTGLFLLTAADAVMVRQWQLQKATGAQKRELEKSLAFLQELQQKQKAQPDLEGLRTAAHVYVAVPRSREGNSSNLARLLRIKGQQLIGQPIRTESMHTLYLPVPEESDPLSVSYGSTRMPLLEGEMFGQMSCEYRTPRPATVVAKRECLVLEFLRVVLEKIKKDAFYKNKTQELFETSEFELQLRKLPLFKDLTQDQFDAIRGSMQMISAEPGEIIFDEHERSDSLYLIRKGLVKVLKNASSFLASDGVQDWPALVAALREGEKPPKPPGLLTPARVKVWSMMPQRGRDIVSQAPDPARISRADQLEVIASLNDVIKQPKFHETKEFQPLLHESPLYEQTRELLEQREALKKQKKDWSEEQRRRCNRLVLEAVLEKGLRRLRVGGPELVLTYWTRGDWFGELGLLDDRPRTDTCIAHGHPDSDQSQIELVKLSRRAFWQMLRDVPALREKLRAEAALRRAQSIEALMRPVWDDARQVQVNERFEELGLIQGQKLMLIDLDRCTRCDECVKACVATHTDGRTRLFLDGPRFGKYLVPTSCRSCLDPVCLTECPVTSIHQGDFRQIIIEDWCIGCGKCADNCPYGSIQMHDLGLVPDAAHGWRYLPAAAVEGDAWRRLNFADSGWLLGDAPFFVDRELTEELKERQPAGVPAGPAVSAAFRHVFDLPGAVLKRAEELRLELQSKASSVTVWLNGTEIKAEGAPKRDGRREYALPIKPSGDPAKDASRARLAAGPNLLAVKVESTAKDSEDLRKRFDDKGKERIDNPLLRVRLDEVRRARPPEDVAGAVAEDILEKLVTERAVVCDLCEGKTPACVHACPHDAAMRVNARTQFPQR